MNIWIKSHFCFTLFLEIHFDLTITMLLNHTNAESSNSSGDVFINQLARKSFLILLQWLALTLWILDIICIFSPGSSEIKAIKKHQVQNYYHKTHQHWTQPDAFKKLSVFQNILNVLVFKEKNLGIENMKMSLFLSNMVHPCLDYTLMDCSRLDYSWLDYRHLDYLWCLDYRRLDYKDIWTIAV